jgi:tetratricopeptide (TPR) repeat protein
MSTPAETFALAFQSHRAGNLPDAEKLCREVLHQQPRHADAVHLLGAILYQQGRHDEAIAQLDRALELVPNQPIYQATLGWAYSALGLLPDAEVHWKEALRLNPQLVDVRNNLGVALYLQGKLDEAIAQYREAARVQPNNENIRKNLETTLAAQAHPETATPIRAPTAMQLAEAHNNLGASLIGPGRAKRAAHHFEEAIRLNPEFPEAHNNLGVARLRMNRSSEALAHWREALRLRADYPEPHFNLGSEFMELGRYPEAENHFQEALRIKPDFADVKTNLGSLCVQTGRFEEARNHLHEALRLKPHAARAYYTLSELTSHGFYEFTTQDLENVSLLLGRPDLSIEDATLLQFALGNVFNKKQLYDEAFRHYEAANAAKKLLLRERGSAFRPEKQTQLVDRLISTFDGAFFSNLKTTGVASDLPIFIIGMPRSGTTLVEQILSSHPQIAGAGELIEISQIAGALMMRFGSDPGPLLRAEAVEQQAVTEHAERFLAILREVRSDARRITDKMPVNFLHLGVIAMLFPKATIVHCRRDPLDVCVSCYCQNFKSANFTNDLRELGLYYREYRRLMEHWRAILPMPIHEVMYEELVADQEAVTRKLIAACGLDWDDRCLAFHDNPRPVQTASFVQIRQPLSARSVGRWKNFEKFLGPLREGLGV